jgi:hypothetical protein
MEEDDKDGDWEIVPGSSSVYLDTFSSNMIKIKF